MKEYKDEHILVALRECLADDEMIEYIMSCIREHEDNVAFMQDLEEFIKEVKENE